MSRKLVGDKARCTTPNVHGSIPSLASLYYDEENSRISRFSRMERHGPFKPGDVGSIPTGGTR